MVDLHCHILPGLDDGAASEAEALQMVRLAHADGVTDIVATPHMLNGMRDLRRANVEAARRRLQDQVRDAGLPLRLHVGAEVHVTEQTWEAIRSGKVLMLGAGTAGSAGGAGTSRKYVLLELPVLSVPLVFDDLLHELRIARITPILAHPERNAVLRDDPARLLPWIEDGLVVQVTAGSLLGEMGRRSQSAAERMLALGAVHLMASDGHRADRRRPLLSAAYERLESVASKAVRELLEENAHAVLAGESCRRPSPTRTPKRTWRFFH